MFSFQKATQNSFHPTKTIGIWKTNIPGTSADQTTTGQDSKAGVANQSRG